MHKLGILVPHLGASHQNYCLLRNVNRLLTQSADTDVILFYENLNIPCVQPMAAMMQIHEAWGFDAPVIATSLSTAEKLIRMPGPTKKIFYTWDLEWLRMPQKLWEQLYSVYAHPSLRLVARGEDHKQILQDAWNKKVDAVIDDFELGPFLNLCYVGNKVQAVTPLLEGAGRS